MILIRSWALTLTLCAFPVTLVLAQDEPSPEPTPEAGAATEDYFSNRFVPDDAILAAFLPVQQMLKKPDMEWMPIEIIQAQMIESVGLDLMHVRAVKAVAGMPGPAGLRFGAVIELNEDHQVTDFSESVLTEQPEHIGNRTVYPIRNAPGVFLYQQDERTFLVSSGGYLSEMLNASTGEGALGALLPKIRSQPGLTLIAVLETIRPLITPVLRQQADKLPAELAGLTEAAELTDALLVNADYGFLSGSLSVSALAKDQAAAQQFHQDLNRSIDFAREMLLGMIKARTLGDSQAVQAATSKYTARVSTKLADLIRPQIKGNVVRVEMEGNMATTGVLVGLLLPAVQAAREAARRMTASNGLKQIALGMHNYHSTFKHLPDRAIRDDDGKPLLSWRVAILPFIEQQELYQKFHLDEPWDSEHNLSLLPEMPSTFVDPSVPAEPGYTVFQYPVGEQVLIPEEGQRRFREITDGLSNTIMVVEVNRDDAVPWTQPSDMNVDLDNPLPQLGNTHQGGFHVVMADGAVKFITTNVDLGLLRALFTPANRDVVAP